MAIDDFDYGFEPQLDLICNMISMLSIEYDIITERTEEENNGLVEELVKHKPLCYYVMKDNYLDEDKVVLERNYMEMHKQS